MSVTTISWSIAPLACWLLAACGGADEADLFGADDAGTHDARPAQGGPGDARPAPPATGEPPITGETDAGPLPASGDSGSTGSDDGNDAATPPSGGSCGPQVTHWGGLTQYDRTPLGNCGVPWPTDDVFAALSTPDYGSPGPSAACGKCVEITGPSGMKAVVPVVDQCPTALGNPKCVAGHIDLSRKAYAAVVPPSYPYGGEVPNDHPVAWRYVPCGVSGPIVYHFKDGVNPGWIALQIRNTRHGVAKVQARSGGAWIDMQPRTDALAYFIATGLNASHVDVRVTDEYGHVLEDVGLAVGADHDVSGHAQFPSCPP
jgi:expansin (peptidoglycan-binding protein)